MSLPRPITVDFETWPIGSRPKYPPEPVGVSIKLPGEAPVYMAWGHPTENNCSREDAIAALEAVWASGAPVLFHHAKFDMAVASERLGLPELPWQRVHDTMFLAYLCDPHARTTALKPLSEDLLGWPAEERDELHDWIWAHRAQLKATHGEAVVKSKMGAWIFATPGELCGRYANGDTARTAALFDHLWPLVVEYGMEDAYVRERRLLPVLMENERIGIRIDAEHLGEDIAGYRAVLEGVEEWLRMELRAPGLSFDADRDVASILLERGVVPKENWTTTKTGQLSMAKDALTPDMFADPRIAAVLGYRNRLCTCLKMFMEPWHGQAIQRNGYISTNWNQTRGGDGGTRCMPAGELVLTNRGYLPVEQVRRGDLVLSHTGAPRAVTAVVDNGVQSVRLTLLDHALALRTTDNHEFLCADGEWRRADALQKGAQIVVASAAERWAPVEGWPYRVSSWGRVESARKRWGWEQTVYSILKQQKKDRWGHLKVTLRRNGARVRGEDFKDFAVHRLVASAFEIEGRGPEVRHLNGIAWDNGIDNLAWGTSAENKKDALEHGTLWPRRRGAGKLSEEIVAHIRAFPLARRDGSGGPTNADLAAKYGVCERLVRAARNGARWQAVPEPKGARFGTARVRDSHGIGEHRTYGLEVEEDHSHVTAGVVTHNTGRPSTTNPNFLNISKDFEGRDDGFVHPAFLGLPPLPLVRKYMLPDEGAVWLHRDFNSQEMRVFADLEQGALWRQYLADPLVDVHAYVGAEAMRLAQRVIERTKIKVLNFQALYGGGVPAAAAKLRCSMAEAKEFKAFHDKALPGRKLVSDEMKRMAKRGEPIRTWGGRLYYCEPSKVIDGRRREMDYKLINYYVQGSAADLTKEAIIYWHAHPDRTARFLVTVYDEINASAPTEVAPQQMELLRECMQLRRLSIEMISDGKMGFGWGDLEKCA